MNVKELHKGIRRLASQLDPEAAALDAQEFEAAERKHLDTSKKEIWLVSRTKEEVGSVGGRVVSAHPMIAARWIQEQTHELATPEQVSAHKAELAKKKEDVERAEADRKGVPTSKLLEALTASLTSNAAPGGKTRERG